MTGLAATLLPALALDLLLADPHRLPHPVSGVAWFARSQERLWRAGRIPLRWAGAAVWCSVVATSAGSVALTLWLLPRWAAEVYWIYSLLALGGLDRHAMAVVRPLRDGDLPAARVAVGMMVGRDTRGLDEPEVTRALIETVAENTSDGVIAPLFWLCAGGPVAMAAYKAVNTLDSLFGYKNERYREFGWWPARADDWANWIPARLTAGLFWAVALVWPGLRAAAAVRATLRDAPRQPSPNSGYPEAAAAGALGVRLGGENVYGGTATRKEYLGEAVRPLTWRAYSGMRVLLYGSTAIAGAVALAVRGW